MKRYWKIISMSLVTLLVLGTFYIQSSLAANKHLEIEFEKVSGNENEMKNLVLYGDYSANHFYLNQSLQITTEETIDPHNLSFFQKLSGTGAPYPLEGLVEKHKRFMRSKDLSPRQFFEDESLVAYARILDPSDGPLKDLTFEIEVLTKQSEEITTIQSNVPQKENYGWMHVEDVQVIEGELKVIARGYRDGGNEDLNVYTFNIEEQALVSADTIASTPVVKNGSSDFRIINDGTSIQRQKYLLLIVEAFEEDDNSNGEPKLINDEIIVYDIENNHSKKIVGPNEILGSMDGSSTIHDSTIFIPSQTANGLEINRYHIENDKWDEKLLFDSVNTQDEEDAPYMKLMNGKLYTIHATTNGHQIIIGDLLTGESLYEGKLKVKNQKENQKDYNLYYYEIEYVH